MTAYNRLPIPKRGMRLVLDLRDEKQIELVLAAKIKVGVGHFTKYLIGLIKQDMEKEK